MADQALRKRQRSTSSSDGNDGECHKKTRLKQQTVDQTLPPDKHETVNQTQGKRKRGDSTPEGDNAQHHKHSRLEESRTPLLGMNVGVHDAATQGGNQASMHTPNQDILAEFTILADRSPRPNSPSHRRGTVPQIPPRRTSSPDSLDSLERILYSSSPIPAGQITGYCEDAAGGLDSIPDEFPGLGLLEAYANGIETPQVVRPETAQTGEEHQPCPATWYPHVPTPVIDAGPAVAENNVDDDGEVQITGFTTAAPVDLTGLPSPTFIPLSPLEPGRFRYFRPGRPGPRRRVPFFPLGEADGAVFDYDFSDDDDVPTSLLVPEARGCYQSNPDEDIELEGYADQWYPNEVRSAYGTKLRELNDYTLFHQPKQTKIDADPGNFHRQSQERRHHDWLARMAALQGRPYTHGQLVSIGLSMNRLLRIYRNGCLRGAAPLGEEFGRAQGAAAVRPPPQMTRFEPTVGDLRFTEPLRKQGLNALYRNRERVKAALDEIPLIFKVHCVEDPDLPLELRRGSASGCQKDLQEQVKAAMSRHRRGEWQAFYSGFEVLSALDLQAITRICRFGEAKWKTPERTIVQTDEGEELEVWEV